jgi:hypothetical protein
MAEHSPRLLELAKHGATFRMRELANELKLLLELFPDLLDSFDPDELPVSFIVRRDANQPAGQTVETKKGLSPAGRGPVKKAWRRSSAGLKASGDR